MIKIQCELCGSEERLFRVLIEGTELNVCRSCSGFGKVLGPVKEEKIEVKEKGVRKVEVPEIEVIEVIVSDFSKRIRRKREQLGLTQKEFANRISEKESVVHKLEIGEFAPSIKMARKLERMIGIKLVEEHEEKHGKIRAGKIKELTIGDLVKIRRR